MIIKLQSPGGNMKVSNYTEHKILDIEEAEVSVRSTINGRLVAAIVCDDVFKVEFTPKETQMLFECLEAARRILAETCIIAATGIIKKEPEENTPVDKN